MQKAKILINNIRKIFFCSFFAALFLTQQSLANTSRNLTIFAEPNMVLALTKIAHIYSGQANVVVAINFNSATDLINSIDSGEPADIFISSHSGWIEMLHQKGLVDVHNISYIASDELVLVASKLNQNLPQELKAANISLENSLKILNQNKASLVIDFEGNSSGKFSQDFIQKHDLPDLKLFKKLAEDKSPILSALKTDPEQYALLLKSQITNNDDLQILAGKKDVNIFYQALVIAGDNMEAAREFLKFLKSETAKKILEEKGFGRN